MKFERHCPHGFTLTLKRHMVRLWWVGRKEGTPWFSYFHKTSWYSNIGPWLFDVVRTVR